MGCAIAENQEQPKLHSVDRSIEMPACCPRRIPKASMEPINPKVSQLKESHSALVKILESAPLKKATKQQSHPHQRIPNQQQTQPQFTPTQPTNHSNTNLLLRPESGSESISLPPSGDNPISRPPNHNFYRKRAKHLAFCDTASSSGDDEDHPQKQSTDTMCAEVICPWKKTRIAREWRQKRESIDAYESAAEQIVCDEYDEDDGVDINDDENYDAFERGCCECPKDKLIDWRRASSESSSGCDDGHQSPSPPNTKIHGPGSECGDSDCKHGNISELCKKFNENLSEEDVRIKSCIFEY